LQAADRDFGAREIAAFLVLLVALSSKALLHTRRGG
jgi:hypothetical protein